MTVNEEPMGDEEFAAFAQKAVAEYEALGYSREATTSDYAEVDQRTAEAEDMMLKLVGMRIMSAQKLRDEGDKSPAGTALYTLCTYTVASMDVLELRFLAVRMLELLSSYVAEAAGQTDILEPAELSRSEFEKMMNDKENE